MNLKNANDFDNPGVLVLESRIASKNLNFQKNHNWKGSVKKFEYVALGGYLYLGNSSRGFHLKYLFLLTLLLNIFNLSCSGILNVGSLFDKVYEKKVKVEVEKNDEMELENGSNQALLNDSNSSPIKETTVSNQIIVFP